MDRTGQALLEEGTVRRGKRAVIRARSVACVGLEESRTSNEGTPCWRQAIRYHGELQS